jgi:hypothetical protein
MTTTVDGMAATTTDGMTTTVGTTTTTGGTTTTVGTTTTTGGGTAINPAVGSLGDGGGGTLVTAGGHPGGRNIVSPREESRAIWQKRLLRWAAEGGKEKTTALVGQF